MIEPSPFSDHIKIAVLCWSRDRARQMSERASKVPPQEMEQFLTELLADALLTFNREYNRAYNEHIEQLWRFLDDKQAMATPPPMILSHHKQA